jgi:hypothetical protein
MLKKPNKLQTFTTRYTTMSNNNMNLSIVEMMELILTGANGSELAVEGVMRTAIEHIKKLEKQNKIMLDAIKEAVSYPDDYYWRTINELLQKTLQVVEGESK